jgi:hypothetical protein
MKINAMIESIEDSWGEVIAEINENFDNVIFDEMAFSDLGFTGQDIIDTGRLLASKEVSANGNKAVFSWNPHSPENGYAYAKAVREGFFAFGGSKFIPGRPWDERAIQISDPVQSLADKLEAKGFKVKILENNIY